jgi:hypothetical protein
MIDVCFEDRLIKISDINIMIDAYLMEHVFGLIEFPVDPLVLVHELFDLPFPFEHFGLCNLQLLP